MEDAKDVLMGSSPSEEVETEEEATETQEETPETPEETTEDTVSEDEQTPTISAPTKSEEKVVPYSRFKEVNDKLKELKDRPSSTNLDVEDYIGISAALDGLDQREKEYLAKQHKLSGQPLKKIRESEDFAFWQTAYRDKVEKEKLTLSPSTKQSEADKPTTLTEKLARANTIQEKEKILRDAGLYKEVRPRSDRTNIGNFR